MDAAQENADERPANVDENVLAKLEQVAKFQHAISCGDADCSQPICLKIKAINNHYAICQERSNCVHCKFLFKFFGYHAQRCTDGKCQVPFCFRIKQKFALNKTFSRVKRHQCVDLL
ncbi:protein cbp-1-like [Cydia fagiglandana]|uniref:protein cbp-1-like n=1 Tax=Cydia fagiglandana TaxID=1458189 RepID=UPI002FEDF777